QRPGLSLVGNAELRAASFAICAWNCNRGGGSAIFTAFCMLAICVRVRLGLDGPLPADELGDEGLWLLVFAQRRLDAPVLFGHEGADVGLTLADQPNGHRLDAAGAGAPLHAPPEQGADLVAHQTVEDAPGLLRIEEILVNAARVGDGVLHRALGDLI